MTLEKKKLVGVVLQTKMFEEENVGELETKINSFIKEIRQLNYPVVNTQFFPIEKEEVLMNPGGTNIDNQGLKTRKVMKFVGIVVYQEMMTEENEVVTQLG